ncbi:MAG: hypothetical protein LBS56_09910 [Propionibacteriaceae bacterium]|jgi:iron complex transport system substrate-binding protein|nr:hypothetical protein [Propionibacteriaceae bacterium]
MRSPVSAAPGPLAPRAAPTSPAAGRPRRRRAALLATVALAAGLAGCGPAAPDPTPLAPGRYVIDVALSGGSGKATVRSPTELEVTADGTTTTTRMTATIQWSSPHYTWMEVGGTRHTPVSAPGEDSAFEIPVTLDQDMAVSAETTAMSTPHTIEYTLRFDSATAKAAQ